MKTLTIIVAALALLSAAGCQPQVMTTPDGYVRLANPPGTFAYKAVSAEGVSVGLWRQDNEEGGTLDFWATALKNQLIDVRGYSFTGDAAATSADGVAGRRLDFTANVQGQDMAYLLALWVDGQRITLVEAGGPKDKFDADRARLIEALKTVRAR